MNPQRLQLPDGTPIDAYQCAECKRVYREREPYSSGTCCVCQVCGITINSKTEGYYTSYCRKCRSERASARERERLEKATVLTDYKGPVVIDDRYWQTIGDLVDERNGDDLPEFVHTCHVRPRVSIDIDEVIQNCLENSSIEDDDASPDDFDDIDNLRAEVANFNELNKTTVFWEQDNKHKVSTREA